MPDREKGAHSAWYSPNIPGLMRRRIKSIHVEYEDAPPPFIAKERIEDIVTAMRLGFEKLDRSIDEAEARARLGIKVSGSQED